MMDEIRKRRNVEVKQKNEIKPHGDYGDKITKWATIVAGMATLITSAVSLYDQIRDKE